MLERRVVEPAAAEDLLTAWQELTRRSARSPFESPDWLMPWYRHYGSSWRAELLTWWRDGRLVGIAPVASRELRRHRVTFRELTFWGWTETPIRGWVDVVADPDVAEEVSRDFLGWLAAERASWDVFRYVHLSRTSPTLAALSSSSWPWWQVDLSPVIHSREYVVSLPEDPSDWRGQLGPKARHEMEREVRAYERRLGGRIEVVADPACADEIVDRLHTLMAAHWADREAYFGRDPGFGPFLQDAVGQVFRTGFGWALVARNPQTIAACLVVFSLGPAVVATMVGVDQDDAYRHLSLGKCLFGRALDDAVARGCREFSFLTENGYKVAYWHARGRPTSSGLLGRGVAGRTMATYSAARRLAPRTLKAILTHRGDDDRP